MRKGAGGHPQRKVAEKGQEKLSKEQIKKLDLVKGLSPKQVQDILYHMKVSTKEDINETIGEPGHLKLGLLSDTHYGNKMCARDQIGEFMDKAKSQMVECFLLPGDLTDGDGVYPGQVYEQDRIGFDEQVADVVENFPVTGLPTYFIQGNHDESFLKKTGGDIGKTISMIRKDMINLGFYNARVKLNGVDSEIQHGGGNSSYAWSYKPQKYLENANPKDQPHLRAGGHRHRSLYMFYRKIHTFLPGAFLKANLLAKRYNLDTTLGGWVIEITIDKHGGSEIDMKFIKTQ